MSNVYTDALHRAIPRLLSSFNADTTSNLYGVGDRYHWAWKLIDFPNGTFQGAVHGLAILLRLKSLPSNLSELDILGYIRLLLKGLKSITATNGSLDEALPNEASFCVTALVASDVLATRNLLEGYLSPDEMQEWLEIVRPLIAFLNKQDESHALISNHLASGALAMFRWHAATGDTIAESRGKMWLDRILRHQSPEGWFSEYGGADPGYQTWCTTQLAQLHLLRPDLGIIEPLKLSFSFLVHAAHPDGSFGGSYGNRNTRFLLPGGIQLLSGQDANASALSSFARNSISKQASVTLDCMDAGNLVPFFNDYALAAWAERTTDLAVEEATLPCHSNAGRRWFPEAGWIVDCGPRHYSIVNMKRGGAAVHFFNKKRYIDNPGSIISDSKKILYSSQLTTAHDIVNISLDTNNMTLTFPLLPVKRPIPGPFDFIVLRLLSITLFRSLKLGNLIKIALVKLLIKRKLTSVGHVNREFHFGENFKIRDTIIGMRDTKSIGDARHFSAIHMASQGYWQRGDGKLSGMDE
jgi:hypothetical protein